jgi:Transposase IS200 like
VKNYRKGSHTVYLLHYQFVFIPKYRKPVLRGDVGLRLCELIRMICHANEIEIVQGHIRPEHVHLVLSVPPDLAPSRVMLRAALDGLPGIGKTEPARQVVARLAQGSKSSGSGAHRVTSSN